MRTHRVMAGLLALLVSGLCATGAAAQGPSVDFAVAKGDSTIFYPTRVLRKGDRFEVNAHHLQDYSRLMVVPCHPDCANPNFVLVYQLRTGIQHLRIPSTGNYYFWLERDQFGGNGIAYRDGITRLPLPVLEQQADENRFVAKFDDGAELSLRTLYTHPLAEIADPAG
ncbi:MAG: hypothetical protein ACREPT_13705 [Rudaea sp.]